MKETKKESACKCYKNHQKTKNKEKTKTTKKQRKKRMNESKKKTKEKKVRLSYKNEGGGKKTQ